MPKIWPVCDLYRTFFLKICYYASIMKVVLSFIIVAIIIALIIPFLRFTPLQPSTPSPTPIPQVPAKLPGCEAITIKSPLPDQKITPPSVIVTVVVDNTNPKCHWSVFEAQAGTLEIQDEDQNTLGTGTLSTNEDWTANKAIVYEGTVPLSSVGGGKANLIITEENPVGSNNPQTIQIPLTY